MSPEEKIAAFDKIAAHLWDLAVNGTTFSSTIAAALIRQFGIEGPNGENPESA